MKNIPNRRHKTKKLIAKIWSGIAILLIAISSVFLFSEKVHKIGVVENVKNTLIGQVEKIQSDSKLEKEEPVEDMLNNNLMATAEINSGVISDLPNLLIEVYRDSINGDKSLNIAEPGDEITYRVTVTNNGNIDLDDVTLTLLTSGMYFKTTNSRYLNVALKVGEEKEVTAAYTVKRADLGGVVYCIVKASVPNLNGENLLEFEDYDEGTVVLPEIQYGNFTISKTFIGLPDELIPRNFYLEYTAKRTLDGNIVGEENGIVTLTKNDNTTYIGNITPIIWRIDSYISESERARYKNVITISEFNAEVENYTYSFGPLYPADGKAINNTVIFELDGATSSKPLSLTNKYNCYYTTQYTIEYYYDNVRDNLKTERRDNNPSNTELKQKIEANVKENYTFKKVEDCTSSYNVIKIYYVSENTETPIEPDYPTDPETGKRLYTITIENDKSGHTYNSYQVFQGDYYEKEEDEKKIPLLSNIEWGPELQKEAEEGKTHGDKIVEALKLQNEETYKDCKTAADVAYALEGKENDGDIIREFTNIVGKYLLDNNITLTKGTNTLIQEKDINGNVIKSNYKIDKLEPGYYIVIDAETNEKDDAYSRYLIDVVQDITMEPKSSIPTIRKKVIGNNIKNQVEGTGTSEENPVQYEEDEKRNTATYKENGEYDIGFELKSYIPETDSYSNYKFEIVDILAKGFDVDTSSIKVMLENNEYAKTRVNKAGETVNNYTVSTVVISAENYNTYKNYFEEEGKTYPEGYAESNYGKTLILVELEDLVGQASEGFVTKGQDVFVKYNSKLNGKGEVGNMPNTNEAYLKYSNDPYHKELTTQTTTQITYTYTIDLNLSKIAEIKKTDNNNENTAEGTESVEPELKYLSGAEFEIYDGPEYIKEEGSLLPSKNPNRKLIATITTSKEEKDEEGNVIVQAGYADYSGLAARTYYIKETKAPDGYNKLKEEIEIEIKAECDEYGAIIWKVEDKTKDNLVLVQMGVKNETSIPEIKLQVQNTEGFELPVTGGKGTIIFTLTGLGIMALAVVCLKNNKKK